MRLTALTLLTAMTATLPSAAETTMPPTAAPTCAAEQQRQFDFWLGQWLVTNPEGTLAGRSRIESILGGCVLLENWDSPSGVSGKSFNLFNSDTGSWEQFWVDNSGSRLHLSGGLRDGNMVLEGAQDQTNPQTGAKQRERITWTPRVDGSVRQLWETSTDGGATWATSFDGLYRPASDPG